MCVCAFREYRSRFASEDTVLFCLRVMVGVIILYDYVHPAGAFVKSSKIDVRAEILSPQVYSRTSPIRRSSNYCESCSVSQMKGCIKVLRDQPPNRVEGLLNALRSVVFTLTPRHYSLILKNK